MKPKKKRTENGPRWESSNPGSGSNSTHVARSRKWWKNFSRRTERRTGATSSKFMMGSKRVLPSPFLMDEKGDVE